MSNSRSLFQLALPALSPRLIHVHTVTGRETLCAPYHFDIDISVPDLTAGGGPREWLGKRAQLVMRPAERVRAFGGIVASVRLLAPPSNRHAPRYRIGLAPRLWTLKFVRRSRIFQDKRVDQILGAVLQEAGIETVWRLRLDYPTRTYCTQYEETDLEFLTRLVAEYGIAFCFEQPPAPKAAERQAPSTSEQLVVGLEKVVFYDDPQLTGAVGDDNARSNAAAQPVATFAYRRHSGALELPDSVVTQFELAESLRTAAACYWEYDPARPLAALHAESGAQAQSVVTAVAEALGAADVVASPADANALEFYEHHAPYAEPSWEYGVTEPQRILRQQRRDAVLATGESNIVGMSPGLRFALDDHPTPQLNRDYALNSVVHEGWEAAGDERRYCYRNRFECVPAEVLFCLPHPSPRHSAVALTATVVGPPGAEIYADGGGRVKVQFHWDREGKRDQHSSCWIRTMQTWSGQGWGSQFVPRVGMEVVVAFDGGDPDRPLVLGCVNNGTHRPAFALPEQQTRSGFRTRSTPHAEGFNELSFDDHVGHEQVYLRAQHDLVELVKHDHATTVEQDQRLTVEGDQSSRVSGKRYHETAGDTVSKTMGDNEQHVGGEHRHLVADNYRLTIDGDEVVRIRGKSLHAVAEDHNLQVDGNLAFNVGSPDMPGATDLFGWGNTSIGSGIGLTLVADQRVSLECGESSITLLPDSIVLRAPKLSLIGEKEVNVAADGPVLRLDDAAELSASSLKLYSSNASVELDDHAHVNGRTVKINCDMTTPTAGASATESLDMQPLQLTLTDAAFEPHAHKPFVVKAAGRRVEGTTAADGKLSVEIPQAAQTADVTLWLGERAQSETRRYVIRLAPIPDVSTVEGIQTRLRHLGYYHRKPSPEATPAMGAAVRDFQRDQGLTETGELDETTLQRLQKVHGS